MKNRERQRANRRLSRAEEKVVKCHRSNCAGCKDGYCRILKTSHFGDKDCPFFKTREQNEKECSAVMDRLIALERQDLIDKYYGGASDGC